MENPFEQRDNIFDISIDATAREYIRTAGTWAKIIAIVGFCSAGLTLLQFIIGGTGGNTYAFVGGALVVLLFVAVGIVINLFLLRFANNILESLTTMSQVQFNEGINNLRTYFKIIGILIIILTSLFLLFMFLFILGSGMRG